MPKAGATQINHDRSWFLFGEPLLSHHDLWGGSDLCIKIYQRVRKNKYPSTDTKKLNIVHRGVDVDRYNPEFKPNDHWLKNWEDEHPHLRKNGF